MMELGGEEHGVRSSGILLERRNHREKSSFNGRSQHQDDVNNITTVLTSTVKLAPVSVVGSSIRYRECLKNHAASVGGSVYDGCGEFMPSGEEGSIEALKCAACDCHRNFHRKEIDGESSSTQLIGRRMSSGVILSPLQLPPVPLLPSPLQQHHHHMHHHKYGSVMLNTTSPSNAMATPMSVAFGGGGGGGTSTGGTESSSEDHLNVFQSNNNHHHHNHNNNNTIIHAPPLALSKKRFRTKFSQDQKEKMLQFAEKVGWRINKQDEDEVERFCVEVGVKRQVFKVWMHNNKNINAVKTTPLQHQQQELS